MSPKLFLLVGAGGLLGSLARYAVGLAAAELLAASFPYGTLTVNIAGSFLIGLIAALSENGTPVSPETRLFLVTGFCGGFTTFSSFMYEIFLLIRAGDVVPAGLYFGISTLAGFSALYLGICLGRIFIQ